MNKEKLSLILLLIIMLLGYNSSFAIIKSNELYKAEEINIEELYKFGNSEFISFIETREVISLNLNSVTYIHFKTEKRISTHISKTDTTIEPSFTVDIRLENIISKYN